MSEERLELEQETANQAFATQHAHFAKPVPPPRLPYEPDPDYQLPAPTIAEMVKLCGENRRSAKDRDTALPAERERTNPFGLFRR